MGSRRHVVHVDGLAIFVESSQLAISGIVPEAVLDTNNDPIKMVTRANVFPASALNAYHKLVKTTPKPNATKNSNGELVAPEFWLLPVLLVSIGLGAVDVPAGPDVLAKLGVAELMKLVGDGIEVVLERDSLVACRATALTTAWTPWARASWTTAMLMITKSRIERIQIRVSQELPGRW